MEEAAEARAVLRRRAACSPRGLASPHHLGRTFRRYLAAEILPPTAMALGVLVLVVLTKYLLGYTDLVINRGLGAGAVARIAFDQTVPLAARTLPFAVGIGCLTALGRLCIIIAGTGRRGSGRSVRAHRRESSCPRPYPR